MNQKDPKENYNKNKDYSNVMWTIMKIMLLFKQSKLFPMKMCRGENMFNSDIFKGNL